MYSRQRVHPTPKSAVKTISIQTVQRSKYKIRRRPTKTRGIAIDLEYWYKGDRFRPTLGYDLTNDAIDTAAAEMVLKIQSGTADQVQERHAAGSMTMADFKAAYLDELRERRVADIHRAEKVIDTYLIVHFTMPLRKIRYSDGQGYIKQRRAANPQPSDGTIAREWSILNSFLNFAAHVGELDANPLSGITAPTSGARNRLPTPEEMAAIAQHATGRLKRAACVAMNTGLRCEKVWMIRPTMIVHETDGPWLELPAPRSKKKGNPTRLPLNAHAYEALTSEEGKEPDERIFHEWAAPGALSKAWARAAEDTGCGDLRFHDLRRWFSSTLEDLGAEDREEAVNREVVKHLMGHQAGDVLEKHYLVRSKGWSKKLRKAVEQLANRYECFLVKSADY
ncbi:MAG: tyrosine-type recombinase/integrase [Nitrospira sp.]|nr:tyrosine-type recombinase/integrase [Nitrospira sp.]